MGGYSLNTKPTFFAVPKLLSSWPLGSVYHSHIAVSVDEGRPSVSTAAICSGLTFTALYLSGIPDQARLCYGHHSNVFKLLGASNTVVLARLYQNLTRQPRLPTGVSSPTPNVIQVAGYAQRSTDTLPLLMLYRQTVLLTMSRQGWISSLMMSPRSVFLHHLSVQSTLRTWKDPLISSGINTPLSNSVSPPL